MVSRLEKQAPASGNRRSSKATSLRPFDINGGLPRVFDLQVEIQEYWDILLGREESPVQHGISTLMEVADAYFCRASEISALILQAIREGRIGKGSNHDKFRTGELRLFMEAAKRAADLGSRRITTKQIEAEEARLGRGRRIE
jgi:hypothetical protein